MTSPQLENKQTRGKLIAIAGAIVVFIVVFNLVSIVSLSWIVAVLMAAGAAYFTFSYIPLHLHGRQDPALYLPKEQVYTLGPDELLGRVTKAIKTMRFEGHAWSLLDEDARSHKLTYTLKFTEEKKVDKEIDKTDYELFMLVYAYQKPASTEVSFLGLKFWEAADTAGIKANEIVQQATEAIYSDLQQYEVQVYQD